MKQGLIGSKLKQSYSKYIHEKINHLHYSLKEIKEDELKDLIEKKEYRFLNVTMPYKKEVLPFLDNKSPQVISTHSCNLIVNSHGKLNGFNIVLDTYSGAVHCVDDLSYDIIELYEHKNKEEIKKDMLNKYNELITKIDGNEGILYLDSGNYFEVKD